MQYEKELRLLGLLMNDSQIENEWSDNDEKQDDEEEVTLVQVKQAFRRKLFELHPDFNQGESKERLKQLNQECGKVIKAYQSIRKVASTIKVHCIT